MTDLQTYASQFVESTRDYIHVRPEDRLMIMRPNKTHHLNATACEMLHLLYSQPKVDVAAVIRAMTHRYDVSDTKIEGDLRELLNTLSGLLSEDHARVSRVRYMPFGSHEIKYPVLSEIALTYRCQNRCPFCYADAPRRGDNSSEMNPDQVRCIIDRIWDDARVPTLSFTGGEPTLIPELPEYIAYAKAKGMRTNLITNGVCLADADLVARLAEAGLDSVQVSIEGPTAETHDRVTCNPGSFDKSISGIRHLHTHGLHVHTNTTICVQNRDFVARLPDLAAELGHEYFSMNMVIRTGGAVDEHTDFIGYSEIEAVVAPIFRRAQELGLRMVWYSPVPYCIFNPVSFGLGGNSCAAAGGLLSVAPDGQVLPCSSFERGIGNLLTEPFETIWGRRSARYWRNKEFLPPLCAECDLRAICCGACPLYWDERGNFDELQRMHTNRPGRLAQARWQFRRRLFGRVRGVNLD